MIVEWLRDQARKEQVDRTGSQQPHQLIAICRELFVGKRVHAADIDRQIELIVQEAQIGGRRDMESRKVCNSGRGGSRAGPVEGAGVPVSMDLWRWARDPLGLLLDRAATGGVFELRLWRRALVGYRPGWNRAILGDPATFRAASR